MKAQYELKIIPLEEVLQTLKSPEKYVREKIDNELVQELAESIEKIGLKCPIIVDRDGVIIDGVHRYEALRRIGRKDLQVPIIVLSDVSYSEEPERAIWLAYLVNRYRAGGADDQFNKQLLKETIAKLVLLTLKKLDEDKRREIVREIENGIVPRILVQEIQKITGTGYATTRRWVESLLEPSKEDFLSWLRAELGISISLGPADGALDQEKLKESEEKLKEIVSKSPDPSKAEFIAKIREKIPDIDIEKLNRPSWRMLKTLVKRIDEGKIDEVRRLLSEGNSSSSENAIAGSATASATDSKLGEDQHTNQSTSHDDSNDSEATGKLDGESKHVDQDAKIVEESQSNTTTVAVVVEESRGEKPEEKSEDVKEETENIEKQKLSQKFDTKSEAESNV